MTIYKETERLIIRPITINDAKDMYEYASDDETIEYLTFPKHSSIEASKEVLENFFLHRESPTMFEATCIELKENHEMIGMCEFVHYFPDEKTAEIGYVLKKKYWGKGYMKEAVKGLLEFGFNDLELRRIDIGHFVENTKSQRVIEKVGFHFDGILRQQMKDGKGKYHDKKIYSMFKNEFEEIK